MVSSINSNAVNSLTQLYSGYAAYEEELKEAGENAVVLDMAAGSAFVIGADGKTRQATPAELEKALKDNDLKLDKASNKFTAISDSYSLSSADVNAAQSVGGVPMLPAVGAGQGVGLSPASVEAVSKAYNRFGDQGIETNALMLQGLLAVLRSAQEDRGTNMDLTINASNLKNLATKVQINAKDLAIKSRIEQAQLAYAKAWVTGVISVACSIVGGAASAAGSSLGQTVNSVSSIVGQALNIAVSLGFRGAEKEAKAGEMKSEIISQEAQIEQEALEQALETIKSASSDNRDQIKQVMKLLQDVAQRNSDNVRVLSA